VMGRANIDSAFAFDSVGSWTMNTSTWTPDPDQNWATGTNATTGEMRDAVKVVARQTVPFTFGRLLGWTNHTVQAEAIAIWGTADASTCVRPWAIPYQKLIDQLWLNRITPKPTDLTTYSLTQQDMADLATWTRTSNPVTLTINDNQDDPYTGSNELYAFKIPAAYLADGTLNPVNNGGADYRSEIAAQSCAELAALYPSNTDPTIHIGDWLTAETGKMMGPTHQGISGQGQVPGICGTSDTCNPEVKIIAALWDSYGAAPGVTNGVCSNATSQGCYHVKYLAEFTLTGWDQPSKTVQGYFNLTTLPAGGASGFTAGGTGTLLFKALVK